MSSSADLPVRRRPTTDEEPEVFDPSTIDQAICVSLPGGRAHRLQPLRAALSAAADLVEVRLDLIQDMGRLESWVAGWDLPVVAGCRREEDGGRFRGSEEERLALLQRAAAAGASLIDLEHHAAALARHSGWPDRTRFMVSRHELSGPFDRPLAELYRELAAHGPAMVKLVPTARTLDDGFDFLGQLKRLAAGLGAADPPLAAFCMGDPGIFTRILAFSHGSSLVYAATAPDAPVAPGQLPVEQLTGIYRSRELGPDTCFTGILGSHVAASLSPLIHNHLYRLLGFDRCYLPLPSNAADLPRLLRRFATGDLPLTLGGLSVTAPFKMAVVPLVHQLAPCAGRAGAVNTLVRRPSGELRGFNTDVHGVLDTLRGRGGKSYRGKKALVIGAGGAARAAALALATLGMRLSVANRTASRGRALAREWGGVGGGLDSFCGDRFHLVVNTTPALSDERLPSFQLIEGGTTIFDLNYHPSVTPLLAAGRRLGCSTLDGLQMLACQGERQFRLFTGRTPPRGAMLEILRSVGGGGR